MNIKKLKLGIIGLGHLGNFHIQQYKKIKNIEIVGVFDIKKNTLLNVSNQHDVFPYKDLISLLTASDAVSITTPTSNHYEIANLALDYNCHLFIEKPITSKIKEADFLIKKSNKKKLFIQVGHIEHFNPAFLSINKKNLSPLFIESHRLAPFNIRGTDVPVVLDLMIHDIGLVLSITQSPIKSIKANGVSLFTTNIDLANARIEFMNGCVANLTASRISQKVMRKFRIFQKHEYNVIDFKNNNKTSILLDIKNNKIKRSTLKNYKGNALMLELKSFINCIIKNKKPEIDAVFAKKALSCAIKIQQIINNNV